MEFPTENAFSGGSALKNEHEQHIVMMISLEYLLGLKHAMDGTGGRFREGSFNDNELAN